MTGEPRRSREEAKLRDLEKLRAAPLFAGLGVALLERIQAISRPVNAAEGEELFRQGTYPEYLHLLLEGQVALTGMSADGSTALVEVVRPGEHFILAAVLAELPYSMTARAVAGSRLLAIEAAWLLRLMDSEPELAAALRRSVSREFGGMVRQVRDLKLRTTAQRLGCYLLGLVQDAAAETADFRLPFEKGLLAGRLGCRQENLSRAFATLREHGVETHGSRVILHDIPRLKGFALPDDDAMPTPGR